MAITIDWSDPTPIYYINVPQSYLTFVSGTTYELDADQFRKDLGDIMDSADAMPYPKCYENTAPKTVAGVTLARVVEIIAPYLVVFEDGLYNVNIIGGNTNIADVVVKNQVGVNTANSAGLIVVETGVSGLTPTESAQLDDIAAGTTANGVLLNAVVAAVDFVTKILRNRRETNPVDGKQRIYDDDSTTVLLEGDLFEDVAGTQPYQGQGADRADRME